MAVKDMAFVAYSVKDSMLGDQWAEFDVGATTFGVGTCESIGFVPDSQFSALIEVDDIANIRERRK